MTDLPSPYPDMAAVMELTDGEIEAGTLREAAKRDPIRGGEVDFEGQAVGPGAWRFGYQHQVSGLPLNCPVQPLGKDGSSYYFLDTLGAVYLIKASSSGKGEIDSLFAGRPLFLEWAWPRWQLPRSREERPKVKGWEADEARRDLFAACAYKGTFELEDRVRGRGAWRDDDGALIYHAGNAVWIAGKWERCGEIGRFIYPARPVIGRPSDRYEPEGPGSPGDAVLQELETWNWERGELDARLALGWMMCAKIGGALDQRPVVYLSGEEGSGKTRFQKMMRALMNGSLMSTSNTTQAGVYQRVRQDSVAVLVDENEPKPDSNAGDKLLELARIAYSGDKMTRGDKDGVGREFALMSSFMASSIIVPAMDSQDASRMALLVLRTRDASPNDAPLDANKLDLWGRQLLRRLFHWYPRWVELNRLFVRSLIQEGGHDSRSAETFAPLAAGAHVALYDDMPSEAQMEQWRAWLRADQLLETAGKEKTWRRVLTYMLQAQPDSLRNASKKSVGEALQTFRDEPEIGGEQLNHWLTPVGLAASWANGGGHVWDDLRLFVPAKHAALHGLFEGTNWAGRPGAPGPWLGALRQAPKDLWENGKCGRGLDKKASGIFVRIKQALDA